MGEILVKLKVILLNEVSIFIAATIKTKSLSKESTPKQNATRFAFIQDKDKSKVNCKVYYSIFSFWVVCFGFLIFIKSNKAIHFIKLNLCIVDLQP